MKTNIKSKILLCALLTTVLLFLFFTVFVEGAEKEGSLALPEEYSAVVDSLPSDIESALPDGVFSDDAEQLGEAVEQMSRAEYIISYIGELLSLGMPDAVGLLVAIVGILMVGNHDIFVYQLGFINIIQQPIQYGLLPYLQQRLREIFSQRI